MTAARKKDLLLHCGSEKVTDYPWEGWTSTHPREIVCKEVKAPRRVRKLQKDAATSPLGNYSNKSFQHDAGDELQADFLRWHSQETLDGLFADLARKVAEQALIGGSVALQCYCLDSRKKLMKCVRCGVLHKIDTEHVCKEREKSYQAVAFPVVFAGESIGAPEETQWTHAGERGSCTIKGITKYCPSGSFMVGTQKYPDMVTVLEGALPADLEKELSEWIDNNVKGNPLAGKYTKFTMPGAKAEKYYQAVGNQQKERSTPQTNWEDWSQVPAVWKRFCFWLGTKYVWAQGKGFTKETPNLIWDQVSYNLYYKRSEKTGNKIKGENLAVHADVECCRVGVRSGIGRGEPSPVVYERNPQMLFALGENGRSTIVFRDSPDPPSGVLLSSFPNQQYRRIREGDPKWVQKVEALAKKEGRPTKGRVQVHVTAETLRKEVQNAQEQSATKTGHSTTLRFIFGGQGNRFPRAKEEETKATMVETRLFKGAVTILNASHTGKRGPIPYTSANTCGVHEVIVGKMPVNKRPKQGETRGTKRKAKSMGSPKQEETPGTKRKANSMGSIHNVPEDVETSNLAVSKTGQVIDLPHAKLYEKDFTQHLQLINAAVAETATLLTKRPRIDVRGKEQQQPRDVGFFSNEVPGYMYSKRVMARKPLTGNLAEVLGIVNDTFGEEFNAVLVNRYVDGKDSVGEHSESKEFLDERASIVTLSKGAARTLRVRPNEKRLEYLDFLAKEGYAVQMWGPDFQSGFKHEIPKQQKVKEERVSLTFRKHDVKYNPEILAKLEKQDEKEKEEKSLLEKLQLPSSPVLFFSTAALNKEFSNFWKTDMYTFEIPGCCRTGRCEGLFSDIVSIKCAEASIMLCKARYFCDKEVWGKILKTTNPSAIKKLGNQVSNFNEEEWKKIRAQVAYASVHTKFATFTQLKEQLLSTGNRRIAEAAPQDLIWGIGLSAQDERALDRSYWRGENLLGKTLELVRQVLRDEEEIEKEAKRQKLC